ncbi:MAG TPA: ATP-dependent Clp protease adaptor ClpS [Saprospiraceae bacterium]|nr:ATP-dependent Clp protease adaptor ClpS [Saprospiraceae bacterium]
MLDIKNHTQEQEALLEDLLAELVSDAQLVVYNDDQNTFDWVIECFMDVLQHSSTQAEQLAMMIHFKGKATVKTAPKEILKPMKSALTDRGLSVVIE